MPDEPVPLTVMVLVPAKAIGETLIVRIAEALPPLGTEIGLGTKLENVIPEGTDPVVDSVTEPE